MYGFRLIIGKANELHLKADDRSFIRRYDEGEMHLIQWSMNKFKQDKLWVDRSDYFLAVDGVLFNRTAIEETLPHIDVCYWRGTFACVYYDKQSGECTVFNDQIGSKMLFWCQIDDAVYVSSDLFELSHVSGLKAVDESFMQHILTRGYGTDDTTAFAGIHRLCAGQCLRIHGREVRVEQYHHFDDRPLYTLNDASLQEADRLFRQAVQRVLDKNAEYGLPNLFPLSGGLDSRMVQTVVRRLTNKPVTNFTYSQTGHYDHTLPEYIAKALGNEWVFLPLDGGDYLCQVDAIVRATHALINFNGPSEIYFCTQQLDFSKVGMVLTGVNGDNIFSVETDSSREIERLYSLSFSGNGLGSPLVLQQTTETYSPFCDVDVLEYVLHIPNRERWNYRFYDQWILRYYPEAAQWDHKGQTIGHRRKVVCLFGRHIPLRDMPKRLLASALKRLHIANLYALEKGASMNPYDAWWQENPHLRNTFNQLYNERKSLLQAFPNIAQHAAQLWQNGDVYEKCAVLTVLSILTYAVSERS